MNEEKEKINLAWELPKEEVFKAMIAHHNTKYFTSLISIIVIAVVCTAIFGTRMGALFVIYWSGFSLGQAYQRLEILNAEFSDKLINHKIALFGITIATIVVSFLCVRRAWGVPF